MDFLRTILLEPGTIQSLFVLMLTISLGTILSAHLKIGKFSLGVTWILFLGILLGAIGLQIDPVVEEFIKNFGLTLFVYSIGLQMGPAFGGAFSKAGLRINLLASLIVLLECLVTVGLFYLTHDDFASLVGVLSGAVTSTPAMGAASQTFMDLQGEMNTGIASGYAVAYPLGVMGTLCAILLIKTLLRIDTQAEDRRLKESINTDKRPICADIKIQNPQIETMTIMELKKMIPAQFIVSRVIRPNKQEEVAELNSEIHNGDILRVLSDKAHLSSLKLLGKVEEHKLRSIENSAHLISTRIVVTKEQWNGKKIGDIDLRSKYHANITRVVRAGIDLLATPDLVLQLGDRLIVVGDKEDVKKVADIFGNQLKRLDLPNLLPISLGLVLGIIIGLLPLPIPGLKHSFSLGIAGGALIAGILVGRYGPYYKMVTFTTASANMMLRQVGLCLFLAAVGLSAGETFIPNLVAGGYRWIAYALLLSILPATLVGMVVYKKLNMNFHTICGLIVGAHTCAPVLSYAESLSDGSGQASVGYASVYPLTTFLRIMCAQIMIIIFC